MGMFGGGSPTAPGRKPMTDADIMGLIEDYKAKEGESLARRYNLENKWAPKFAGIQDKMAVTSADTMAGGHLNNLNKYGPKYVEAQDSLRRKADPTGARIRDSLGSTIEADLNLGGRLDDSERREIAESVMASQTARGNNRGTAAELEQITETGAASRARKNERMAAAAGFSQGQNNAVANMTNQAATGQIVPWMPQNRSFVTDASNGLEFANVYQGFRGQDLNFASQIYGQQSQNWATSEQLGMQEANMWMDFAGTLIGGAAGAV